MNSRRRFIKIVPIALGMGLLGNRLALAQVKVAESDPTAVALGYKEDTANVDRKKFTVYKPGDTCANCQLYLGKPGDAAGPCTAFGNKLVVAKGWCSAHVKKA